MQKHEILDFALLFLFVVMNLIQKKENLFLEYIHFYLFNDLKTFITNINHLGFIRKTYENYND